MPDCQVSSCVIGGGQKNDKVSVLQSCESVIKIDLIWLALCRKRPMQICMCCACWRVFSVSVASCIWKGFFTHTLREHCNTGVRPHQAFLPESALLRLVSGSKAFAVLQTCSLFVDVRAHTGARSAPEEVLRGQELHAGLQGLSHNAVPATTAACFIAILSDHRLRCIKPPSKHLTASMPASRQIMDENTVPFGVPSYLPLDGGESNAQGAVRPTNIIYYIMV
eukprot:scaffold16887_cov22-Tisochrysis_lutea.AAC.3